LAMARVSETKVAILAMASTAHRAGQRPPADLARLGTKPGYQEAAKAALADGDISEEAYRLIASGDRGTDRIE
jgi:hypothetical protein